MRRTATLLLALALASTLASASNAYFQNVIVVIQENRSPDNLFQALCNGTNCGTGQNQFDIRSYGYCQGYQQQVPLVSTPLVLNCDPGHLHLDWTTMYDGGGLDGACHAASTGCKSQYACGFNNSLDCTRYSYVDNSTSTIQPYLDIATQYGWANYMYQTNQGPSFPAHQFLLSGTSAPSNKMSPDYTYFAMDNTTGCTGQGCSNNENAGCAAPSTELVDLITPTGDTSDHIYPCFEHNTLVDLLDTAGVSWRYYSGVANGFWTAPNAIDHLCNNTSHDGGGFCGSNTQQGNQDWDNYVSPYLEGASRNVNGRNQPTLAPFLYDMQYCNTQFANWSQNGGVIFIAPDGRWSDHPQNTKEMGPSWVANIVNAVGQSTCTGSKPNWSNTVILITWDDWGGWYDHEEPYNYQANGGKGGYSNGTGSQYVYGFRVPLLVVSRYTGTYSAGNWSGYISNVTHDFGSILSFIEGVYGLGNIYSTYEYADFFAPDNSTGPLRDFFCYPSDGCQNPRQFTTPITLQYSPACTSAQPPNGCGATQCNQNGACQCSPSCFINYPGGATDADNN